MLSSANLNIEGALISLAFMLFFGAGILYTLIVFIVHSIQKQSKSGNYYLLSFLIAGLVTVGISALLFYMMLLSNA